METKSTSPVEIKGLITAINANFYYREQIGRLEFSQQPTTELRPKPEFDLENIRVSFTVTSPNMGDPQTSSSNGSSITMKRDDIKRLDITVGDPITLRITKE